MLPEKNGRINGCEKNPANLVKIMIAIPVSNFKPTTTFYNLLFESSQAHLKADILKCSMELLLLLKFYRIHTKTPLAEFALSTRVKPYHRLFSLGFSNEFRMTIYRNNRGQFLQKHPQLIAICSKSTEGTLEKGVK